jgi:hypothetical protein
MLANFDLMNRAESLGKSARMLISDTSLVLIIAFAIFAVLALLIKYVKSRRRRIAGGEKVYRSISADADEAHTDIRVRYKRRVRRRDHRVRNPTLSETGGLPPVRTGQPKDLP